MEINEQLQTIENFVCERKNYCLRIHNPPPLPRRKNLVMKNICQQCIDGDERILKYEKFLAQECLEEDEKNVMDSMTNINISQ